MGAARVVVNEGQAFDAKVRFKGVNGTFVTPNSVAWTLKDNDTGTSLGSGTATPALRTTVEVAGTCQRIVDATKDYEEHVLTISAVGVDGKQSTEEVRVFVKNLRFHSVS